MTSITGLGGRNMIGPFTRGDDTIVTVGAYTYHLRMIYPYDRYPAATGCVTGITIIGAINMCGAFTHRHNAIMAANTGALHFVMINTGCRYR